MDLGTSTGAHRDVKSPVNTNESFFRSAIWTIRDTDLFRRRKLWIPKVVVMHNSKRSTDLERYLLAEPHYGSAEHAIRFIDRVCT